MANKTSFLVCTWLLCIGVAGAQNFEVASIHPHAPGDNRFFARPPGNGQFTATGIDARLLVMLAYDVQESQITGGPGWDATEKWDIEAKSNDGERHSVDETRGMLQNMLAERFALKIHRETKELPAYVLTVAKGGPKFQAQEQPGSTNVRITGNSISLEHGALPRMTQLLSSALGRPVVDKTGLSGRYDFSLQWDDAPVRDGGVLSADAPAPTGNDHGSIFTAIQDQLGLRLEPRRAPVNVIVIDRMERPSEN